MNRSNLRQQIAHEGRGLLLVFSFLAPLYCAFSTYRMLLLDQFQTKYFEYGTALLNALLLSKVILVGDYMQLGKRQEDKPLIVSTLFKALLFSLLTGAFQAVERFIKELVHGQSVGGAMHGVARADGNELLGHWLVMVCAFVPFFAFRELGRVLNESTVFDLFFRRRAAADPSLSIGDMTPRRS
jgi:hypothetical protein